MKSMIMFTCFFSCAVVFYINGHEMAALPQSLNELTGALNGLQRALSQRAEEEILVISPMVSAEEMGTSLVTFLAAKKFGEAKKITDALKKLSDEKEWETVKAALETTDGEGRTALMLAVTAEQLELVTDVLQLADTIGPKFKGAFVNQNDTNPNKKVNALWRAIATGDEQLVRLLIENLASVQGSTNYQGRSLITFLMTQKDGYPKLRMLLNVLADHGLDYHEMSALLNEPDTGFQQNAITAAFSSPTTPDQFDPLITLLLSYDPELTKDRFGKNVLDYARESTWEKIIQEKRGLFLLNEQGKTQLMQALTDNNWETVKALIGEAIAFDQKAKTFDLLQLLFAQMDTIGETVLTPLAKTVNGALVIKQLLTLLPNEEIKKSILNTHNQRGQTPLMIFIDANPLTADIDTVTLLLGKPPFVQDNNGETALDYAIKAWNGTVVKAILDASSDEEQRAFFLKTNPFNTAKKHFSDAIPVLLSYAKKVLTPEELNTLKQRMQLTPT